MDIISFLTVVIQAFAIFMVLAGIFTAYFGTGKSRTVGFILLLVGIIAGGVWTYLGAADIVDVAVLDVFLDALVNFVGVLVGAIIAVAIFLVGVMKS